MTNFYCKFGNINKFSRLFQQLFGLWSNIVVGNFDFSYFYYVKGKVKEIQKRDKQRERENEREEGIRRDTLSENEREKRGR